MKKFATLAAAAAIAVSAVAPVAAQDVNADPFVSTAGPAVGLTPGLVAAGIAVTIIGIAALDSSDDT
ncbi:hypothetical protein G5B38_09685 [Pseudohalocynthiibacter aestuariivivens]|uniref:Ferrochelatase n=1 Tax=Roseovarius pelagicus TaxID=2980108 RepID=A0ABY6D863_9RHOB|nr:MULTISPECIES: hypothetical protein [Rhodobacterales]QIE45773.1 hypothetical protein G5B38_09685 [Pseudohalocynthiibacter aestuariivivens]UXX82300.1 hypothetical protein N7U68_14490 [Roseovarius pelagicus]